MTRSAPLWIFLLLAGCTARDPYRRTDVWYPTGANAGNLAAMAEQPRDLISGRGALGSDARQATSAVERLWQGDTKALLPGTVAASSINDVGKGPAR